MKIRNITRYLFGSTRKIADINYQQNNLIMLPKALKLTPNK
jgi:hypothetical protein